jgi:alpha-1,2-glucosyltransferase
LFKVAYALALNLFPLNYFFQYLYYTDNGSTFFCLLAYYQHLRKRQNIAAIVGCVAVLYRQTNIVWIVFYMALTLLINARNLVDKAVKDGNSTRLSWLMRYMIETPEQRQQHNLFTAIHMDSKQIKVLLGNLFELLGSRTIWPYFQVICSFGLFVYANKGIVVGDRSNHEASLHVTQLFYFFTFSIICTAWHVVWRPIQNPVDLIKWLSKRLFVLTVSMIVSMLIVQQFTYEHPFLLADNRHYTFYIWSRLYRRHATIKYFMVPVYVLSTVLFYSLLSKANKSYGWLVAFTICLSLCLIPQKLIEFRYYLIPFFIYRLNIRPQSLALVLGEILVFSMVNIVTMYLFLNRPFYWPDSSEPQRFMW